MRSGIEVGRSTGGSPGELLTAGLPLLSQIPGFQEFSALFRPASGLPRALMGIFSAWPMQFITEFAQ